MSDDLDGFDLLVNDLGSLVSVEDYDLHSSQERETKVLVRLRDGRNFMLTAEQVSP